ncbi:MAG TPA: ABC transporter permease [Beijerinckiaceae bacterium]|jgi:cell division transport system permease protein
MEVPATVPRPSDPRAARQRRSEPATRPDLVTRLLRRDAPLVPVESAASRGLVGVIAILTFLAALCAGTVELVASSSAQWRSAVGREATVQMRPNPRRNIEADLAEVADLARGTAGVAEVHVVDKAESERMLEPWLGRGLDLSDLPVPRLIVLKLQDGATPDFAGLRALLAERVPGATLDDHGGWVSRLSTMANTVVVAGAVLTLLVLLATALAVAFATHGAMAGNREVVEVLHFVGAHDRFIAREFQRRFFRLGLKGGLIGGCFALGVILVLSFLSASWRESPAGDQIEAMFGALDIGWRGAASAAVIVLLVAAITAVVSRQTVKHFLNRTS